MTPAKKRAPAKRRTPAKKAPAKAPDVSELSGKFTMYHPANGAPATTDRDAFRMIWEPKGWTLTPPAPPKFSSAPAEGDTTPTDSTSEEE